MMTKRGLGLCAVALMIASGSPERLSPLPAPAAAATKLICASTNFDYSHCRIDTRNGVRLVQQLSSAPCIQGRTWGTDRGGIWVDRGCAAEFSVSSGSNAGAVVGAAIIGGIVGALLGDSSNDHGYRSATRDNYHYSYRYSDPSPPPYDRYGNPNYDRKGRYTGCHGLGCMVDNPDAGGNGSQEVDPTVRKFDKDGNPNYDADGNYIGAHGLGALVDNPDTSSDGSPNQ